jgi:hypothetical protein
MDTEDVINSDTRRFIQLYKNDPAKMKMLQKNFPEDWEIQLMQKLRNQTNNGFDGSYYIPNHLKSMHPQDIDKIRELERIQQINEKEGFGYPSESQRNLNEITGILSNDQENFIGYPENLNAGEYVPHDNPRRDMLSNLRNLLQDNIPENQQTRNIIPSPYLNNSSYGMPYFTMEGALTPAPQMDELEKLMQRSRQQARR